MEDLASENIALLALLNAVRKPDTWVSLTNECVTENSAVRVLNHRINPWEHPLRVFEDDPFDTMSQEAALFPDMQATMERAGFYEQAKTKAAAMLSEWESRGLDFVSVFDPRFPIRLRSSVDTPPFLFASGTLIPDDTGVSVVGSRHASMEGLEFARQAARLLAEQDLTVIAGLAEGIDAAAHTAALEAGARTVAFIGTGITRSYPASNRGLQQRISEQGLLLSQFFPDMPPSRKTFPMRNALMSAYGIASIIVEAGEHSGTRIQARQAIHQGRPVIFRRQVVEQTTWARQYAKHNPNAAIADNVEDIPRLLGQLKPPEWPAWLEPLGQGMPA